MKTLAIALLAGTAALSAGSARASDFNFSSEFTNPSQTVCDNHGNCYQRRIGAGSVAVRDRYNPPPAYRERGWDDRPRTGNRVPGVSVGVGAGSDRW